MLEKLRAKPEPVRKQLALGITIILFSIIFLVWFSSWDARIAKDEAREKTASPVVSLWAVFQGFTTEIKDMIDSVGSNTPLRTQGEGEGKESQVATSTFDVSGIVVIDRTATSTTFSTIEGNRVSSQ